LAFGSIYRSAVCLAKLNTVCRYMMYAMDCCISRLLCSNHGYPSEIC
jgi:hypothetical protein